MKKHARRSIRWLTWAMRVQASGNLTVELIRAQRFDVACQPHRLVEQPCHLESRDNVSCDNRFQKMDRVLLSPQAIAYDAWAMPADRASTPSDTLPSLEPRNLTPIVGSPALAGLGVALVVPGTLLDVVA